MNDWFRVGDDGCITLHLHIQPGAKTTGCAGLHGDSLKIRLAAPATEGRANAALLAFVAERLGLPRGSVELRSGQTSRQKLLLVSGASVDEVRRLLVQ